MNPEDWGSACECYKLESYVSYVSYAAYVSYVSCTIDTIRSHSCSSNFPCYSLSVPMPREASKFVKKEFADEKEETKTCPPCVRELLSTLSVGAPTSRWRPHDRMSRFYICFEGTPVTSSSNIAAGRITRVTRSQHERQVDDSGIEVKILKREIVRRDSKAATHVERDIEQVANHLLGEIGWCSNELGNVLNRTMVADLASLRTA